MRDVDHIATMAMMGLLAGTGEKGRTVDGLVHQAYRYADEFIKQLREMKKTEKEMQP